MAGYATTRLSSEGRVVPEEIRNNLGLNNGDRFVVSVKATRDPQDRHRD